MKRFKLYVPNFLLHLRGLVNFGCLLGVCEFFCVDLYPKWFLRFWYGIGLVLSEKNSDVSMKKVGKHAVNNCRFLFNATLTRVITSKYAKMGFDGNFISLSGPMVCSKSVSVIWKIDVVTKLVVGSESCLFLSDPYFFTWIVLAYSSRYNVGCYQQCP